MINDDMLECGNANVKLCIFFYYTNFVIIFVSFFLFFKKIGKDTAYFLYLGVLIIGLEPFKTTGKL